MIPIIIIVIKNYKVDLVWQIKIFYTIEKFKKILFLIEFNITY